MARTYVHPQSTSWGSVLGGWLAALGALVIFFPLAALAAGLSPAAQARVDDPTLAFPLVIAAFVSWLMGGYVAGRMAGYRRSWHGLMSAIWGLFVALVVALVAGGGAGTYAAASLPRLDIAAYGNATVFGFVLGIAAVILGGWLGGVLAPTSVARVTEPLREPVIERPVALRPVPTERVAHEPRLWDRLIGKTPEVREQPVPEEKEALVPAAQRTRPEHDGEEPRE